jgi:hypothetical protein
MSKHDWKNLPKKITSWSYSRFSTYTKCPAKAKYKFIDKMPDPGGPAMERGILIHKLAEDYTTGKIKKIPPELLKFKDQFAELKKSKPIVEQTWAFTKDWLKTVYNDWQNCALRIKTDAACIDGDTLYIIDHKTGKKYDDNKEQLELYAAGGGLWFPKVKKIITSLWYLDSGDTYEQSFDAADTPKLRAEWDKRVEPMLNDTRFAPKPSHECRWCPFSKAKGGPCKF